MPQDTWNGTLPADFFSSNWTSAPLTPQSGDTAIIGQGFVQIAEGDILPSPLAFDLGSLQTGVFAIPTSVLNVIGAVTSANPNGINSSLTLGTTIDVNGGGGSFTGGAGDTVVAALLLAYGQVASNASIAIGAGDELAIAIGGDPTDPVGKFGNLNVIDVTGLSNNYGLLSFLPATASDTSALAYYGAINLSSGALTAQVADLSPPPGSQLPTSTVSLSNSSFFFDLAALQNTNAYFNDATDRLDIAQSAAGYVFGGKVENFQSGDVIGLMQTDASALPDHVGYSSGVLSIYDASNDVLGKLNVALAAGTSGDQFVLLQQLAGADFPSGSASPSYTGQYDVVLADIWKSGATADFNYTSDWSAGAPQNGGVAVIQQGVVTITADDTKSGGALPSTLTFSLGSRQTGVFKVPSSILDVIGTNLSSGVTIDVTAPGGSFRGQAGDTVIGAVLQADGTVQSDATIKVGAGDELVIAMTNTSGSSGNFINSGVIDAAGLGNNYADVTFQPSVTNGAGAPATATYGDINLQYAAVIAQAAESGAGTVSLSDNSYFFDLAALQQTNAYFKDATDRLDIGQNAAGSLTGTGSTYEYSFGGTLANFQSGDIIGLMQTDTSAIPTSVSYDSTKDVLTITDGGNHVLGALNVQLASANDQFELVQQAFGADFPSGSAKQYDYVGQIDIVLADAWTAIKGDFYTASNWSNGTPPLNGAVSIGVGTATFSGSGEALDANASTSADTATNATTNVDTTTIIIGAAVSDSLSLLAPPSTAAPSSTSSLSLGGTTLGYGVTIDVIRPGGTITTGATGTSTFMLAGVGANGNVTSDATVNVGAGDAYSVGVAAGSQTPTIPGYYINGGVVNVDGVAGNYAFAQFKQGNAGQNSAINAYAAYGTINVSYGIFYVKAPDFNPGASNPTWTYGEFNLGNDSTVALFAQLNTTGVNFEDGTDTLLIQENGSGAYAYGGAISGFQAGDVIGLMPPATAALDAPASLHYNAATGVLSILDASAKVIGALNFSGTYFGAGFSLATTATASITGSSEYDITYNPNAAGIVTQDSLTVLPGDTYTVPGDLNVRTFVTVDGGGELDVDHAAGATGGSELVAGGALTVDSGGVLAIGDPATTMTASSVVAAASLVNAGTITLVGNGAEALLKIGSAAGTGTAGELIGNISLAGDAVLQFASGAISTLSGKLTLSSANASVGLATSPATANAALSALATISTGAELDLESGATLTTSQGLVNSGTLDLDVNSNSGGSNLRINGQLTNANGGTLDIGDSTLLANVGVTVGQLVNQGTIDFAQSHNGFANLFVTGGASLAVENAGTIEGAGGIYGNYTTPTYNFTNDASGKVTVTTGNNIFLFNFANVTNLGAFSITGGVLNVTDTGTIGSTFTNSGSVQLANVITNVANDFASLGVYGSLDNMGTISGAGTVDDMWSSGGVLTNEAAGQINVGAGQGLSLSGFATVVNNGAFNITGGALNISDPFGTVGTAFTNSGSVTMANVGANNFANFGVSGSLDNKGNLSGEGSVYEMMSSGILTNEAVGTINANTTSGLQVTGWTSVVNYGLLETTGGTLQVNSVLSGSGALTANGGLLHLAKADAVFGIADAAVGDWTYTATGGGTLEIDGALSETGGFGSLVANGGEVLVKGNVSSNVSGTISHGGTLEIDGSFNGNVTFVDPGTLILDLPTSGTITGFGLDSRNSIVFKGLQNATESFDSQTDTLNINNGQFTLHFDSTVTNDTFTLRSDGTLTATPSTACYCRGTSILTARGEVTVENLQIGDLAITASGASRPVVWLGHRGIEIARHNDPAKVWPVRIAAHAFAENQPRRDLWVSPGHNIAWEGALIPASHLVNGVSVAQVETATVEYWHVELDAHDILLAEGLSAESYLDCGNRTDFANGGDFVTAHPDFLPKQPGDTCLPLVKQGPAVERAKNQLRDRLLEQGYQLTADAAPHVRAGRSRVEPVWLSESRMAFQLPEGHGDVILHSDVFVPAHMLPENSDTRALGLCVTRLMIDGDLVPVDDARLSEGWGQVEDTNGGSAWRWTEGAARLPAGARIVIVDLGGAGLYWRAPVDAVVALFG